MINTKIWLTLFSLLGSSSSSSSVDASSFVCVVILSLYLTLNFVISSLIVGTFKSACQTFLDIYHGAFTIARRTLFWYLCNISMFELVAIFHRGTPYVQIGFVFSSLFSIDGFDFLHRIQCICWNLSPSCFLLGNMWVRHVSLLSREIPKYLTVFPCGIWFPFSATLGQFSLFKVKVTWVDLFSLAFIRQRFNHFSKWLR